MRGAQLGATISSAAQGNPSATITTHAALDQIPSPLRNAAASHTTSRPRAGWPAEIAS